MDFIFSNGEASIEINLRFFLKLFNFYERKLLIDIDEEGFILKTRI